MGEVVEFVNMNIGDAVGAMRSGHRVRRKGWNGKGMWLAHVDSSDWQCAINPHRMDGTEESELVAPPLLSFIVMRTADKRMVPWLCSQTDLLANDWEIVK